MTKENGDSQYEHQFEDLNGNPDEDGVLNVDPDEGLDDLVPDELGGSEDDASREAAGDEGADGQSGGQGGGGQDDDDLDSAVDQAMDEQSRQVEREQALSELNALREEVNTLRAEREQDQSRAQTAEIDQQISDTQAAMRRAQEEGDTDTATTKQSELVSLQVRREMAGGDKGGDDKGGDQANRGGQAEQSRGQQATQLPEATRRWLGRNSWFYQGTNPDAEKTAKAAEKALLNRGVDPNSDEFYDALDAQVERRHPGLVTRRQANGNGQGGNGQGGRQRRTGGGPPNGMGAQSRGGNGGRVQITQADRQQMEEFGLDPSNKEHVQAWAREKRASEQSQRRQQA